MSTQQQLDELCAATLRALTGDRELHYRGRNPYRGERALRIYAPHQRFDADHVDFTGQRAAADGLALRLRHSDADVHRSLCPSSPVERLVFELLEQLRVETLVPADMPGMTANLHQRFEAWSRAFHESGLIESSLGILLYTVAQVCWSRLNAHPVSPETEDQLEVTRAGLAPVLGTPLAGLRRWRHDQALFAPNALEIARIVGERVRAHDEEDEGEEALNSTQGGFSLLLDFDQETADSVTPATSGESKLLGRNGQRYRVFTTRFDVETDAASLVRMTQLREYRERLDILVARQGVNIARVARIFGVLLTTPQRDGWRFGEEEGHIDGRRLSQLVSSPAERRLFRCERTKPLADSVVGILVDCSGSMKEHAESVATLADILVRALDMLGIESEVLGFTTSAWNGGRAQQEWLRQGKPQQPGRLNEVCHLHFKSAERNWRRSRSGIAALLKADLYREGIDGEAVDWACERLLGRDATRRILLVVSDGCPMDSATGLANDPFYLDNHLKEVVARREREGAVEIIGLGVGLDLRPFYRRSLVADLAQELAGGKVFFNIARLIGAGRMTSHPIG